MSNDMLLYLIIGAAVLFGIIIIAYTILRKKMNSGDAQEIRQLRQGTDRKAGSSEVTYQKLYIIYSKIPLIKRYLLKLRRRLEILNVDDEYLTRKQASKILTNALIVVFLVTIAVIIITHSNLLLMLIILIFELFIVDTIIDGMVDRLDTNLLNQEIDFFAQMRHAYHETNMVGEAIYQTAQDDDHIEMSRQAEKIYEILISEDPETELEKYYDIAPNNYLKEFAGISYLTQEFGDRKIDGASLYLKNLDNVTQEMQLEILKRDKLNYTFQSLSVISIAPMLLLEPIKNWCVSSFAFTTPFYEGKAGMIIQVLTLILTFICYLLTRKLKDNGAVRTNMKNTENPWQAKLYKIPLFKKIFDMFIPRQGTKEYRKDKLLMKKAATKQKLEWIYINRICLTVLTFIVSIILFGTLHRIQVNYIYTQPTTDYDIIGEMDEKDKNKAMETTRKHNIFLDMFKGKLKTTQSDIEKAMRRSKEYRDSDDTEITQNAEKIYEKLQVVNAEYLKWFEVLLACVFAVIGYMGPIIMLRFQAYIRRLSMEDEVMQFQTIILMLMRLERADVEMILEWLGRYADIFKEPIEKCLNNYESGAWEALEELKDEVAYQPFITMIESMQTAVEKVPIREAFDELDSEREYYQAKRRESNERLIKRKGMIGKLVGFAPMVVVFVAYLIVPLVFIGMTSMSSSFDSLSTMS